MNASWQKTFSEFAGSGIDYPSSMLRVSDAEAQEIVGRLALPASPELLYGGQGRHAGYRIVPAEEEGGVVLLKCSKVVGFYLEAYLWIAPHCRGLGLSTPLILAAAARRGGGMLMPGVVVIGYTPASIAAHRAAHSHAVLTALAHGLPVPPAIVAAVAGPALPPERFPTTVTS